MAFAKGSRCRTRTRVTYQDKQAILTGGIANFFLTRGAVEGLEGPSAASAMALDSAMWHLLELEVDKGGSRLRLERKT
jgi:1,6-anhydro-N-acetylmuramate kinase